MELTETYRRLLRVSEDRLVTFPPGEPIKITALNSAVIFVLAKWSGASQIAFRALNQALAEVSDLRDLRLYILDADDERTERFIFDNDGVPSGGGETYWVKDGRLIAKMVNYKASDAQTLREFAEQLSSTQ